MAKNEIKTTAAKSGGTSSSAGSMKSVGSGQNLVSQNPGSMKSFYNTNASQKTSAIKKEKKSSERRSYLNKRSTEEKKEENESRDNSTETHSGSHSEDNSSAHRESRKEENRFTSAKSRYNRSWESKPEDENKYSYHSYRDKKLEEQVDTLKLLYGIVDQAGNQIYGDVLGALDMFIGTPYQKLMDYGEKKYGIADRGENALSAYNRRFQEKARAEAEDYAENASKNELASLVNEFGPDVLALLPDIAMAYFSGGTSLAAKGTMAAAKTARVAGKASKLDDVMDAVKLAGKTIKDNPVLLSGAVRTSGQSFNQAVSEGADRGKATSYALANGLIDIGLNGIGVLKGQAGFETLPGVLRQTGSSVSDAAKYGKAILHDGFEGIGQGMARRASRAIYDEDVKLLSEDDSSALINPETLFTDFAMGGAGATLTSGLHAGTKALDKPANAAADRLERAYFKDHILRTIL